MLLLMGAGLAAALSPSGAGAEENCALMASGGKAEASSATTATSADKAFDGDANTQWRAGSGTFPQTLKRSFDKVRKIRKIVTVFQDSYSYEYAIYVSAAEKASDNLDDISSWQKIVGPKISGGETTDSFTPVEIRHVVTKFTSPVANGSFEIPGEKQISSETQHESMLCADWMRVLSKGGGIKWDDKVANSGKRSAFIYDTGLQADNAVHLYYSLVPVKPEGTYTFSVYVRADKDESPLIGIRLDQLTAARTWASFPTPKEDIEKTKWGEFMLTSTEWKKFSFTTTMTKDTAFVRPGLFYYKRAGSKPNRVWVDDISLIEGSNETDIAGIVEQKISE
jgi:hypothetical protein